MKLPAIANASKHPKATDEFRLLIVVSLQRTQSRIIRRCQNRRHQRTGASIKIETKVMFAYWPTANFGFGW